MSTCPVCGKYWPPDEETGYNGDDYCSAECEQKAYDKECEENEIERFIDMSNEEIHLDAGDL